MNVYAKLQIATANKIQQFLDIGVPNWRLENLPKLYQDLISHYDLLIDDGLNKDDLMKLKQLEPKFLSICEELSNYKIKDTFCHASFHDKNILIKPDTNQTTIIDLGEVVITHPFFPFLNCLHMARENFSLSDDQYHQLQLTCFEPWLEFESQKNLFDILSIINLCWSIHAALGEYRLMRNVDQYNLKKLTNYY